MTCERLIDVSELEPPEPLLLTLEAVDELPPGCVLRMRHRRDPCLLYDNLSRRGFSWRDTVRTESLVELLIWRQGDLEAEAAAEAAR